MALIVSAKSRKNEVFLPLSLLFLLYLIQLPVLKIFLTNISVVMGHLLLQTFFQQKLD